MGFFNSKRKIKKVLLFLIIFLVCTTEGVFAENITTSDGQNIIDSTVNTTQTTEKTDVLDELTPLTNVKSVNKKEVVYIKNIEVTGTNVIKPEYVLNRLQLQRGDEYSRDFIQNDLKNIYQTGFFTDRMKAISIANPDGSITLRIILEENTPVTDFTIEGNTVISTAEILDILEPLKGEPQNIADINTAIEKIQEYYGSKGYILARVDSLYDDPDGTINVHVNEGEIKRILISGNEKTKDYVIARNVLTEAGMIYNENLIREDLVRLYATQAFKDVKRDIEPSEDDPEKYDEFLLERRAVITSFVRQALIFVS